MPARQGRECEPMGLQLYDKNSFLSALSPSEFGLLRSHLTSFDLRVGDRLHERDRIEVVLVGADLGVHLDLDELGLLVAHGQVSCLG